MKPSNESSGRKSWLKGKTFHVYGIIKGLHEKNGASDTDPFQLYVRTCIIGPVNDENVEALENQIQSANNPDTSSPGEVSSVPGTVYIASADVVQNIGFRACPNSKDSKGNPVFPRTSLPTDKHTNTLYCQYMNSKYPGMRYKMKETPYIKLSDLRAFLRRKAGNRSANFDVRKRDLSSCLEDHAVAKGLSDFWRDYPKKAVTFLEDVPKKLTGKELPEKRPLVRNRPDPLSSKPLSLSSKPLSPKYTESPENTCSETTLTFREHVFSALDDEEYISSAKALREVSKRSIPIRHRVVQCLVPLGNREPFSFVGTLPKGIMLEFPCVPFDGKDTRANYNHIQKNTPLESPDPEASLENDVSTHNHRVSPLGNLHMANHRGETYGIWTRKVRSATVIELMTWDTKFADLEYKLNPGVALLMNQNDRKYREPEPLDLSHLPEECEEDLDAKEQLQMMHVFASTRKQREKHRTNMYKRRMYVPCISVDDLMRSGMLPSVEKVLAKISGYILGINGVQASEFLFPRLANQEVSRRKTAASYFRDDSGTRTKARKLWEEEKKGTSARKHSRKNAWRRKKFVIDFEIPHSAEPGTKEYKEIKRNIEMMIAYYEKAPLVKKQVIKDMAGERELLEIEDCKDVADLRLFLKDMEQQERNFDEVKGKQNISVKGKENLRKEKGKEKERLEHYEDFLSSDSEDSEAFSFSDDSRDRFPISETETETETRTGSRAETSGKKNKPKLFPVRRNFTVRRVDNLSTRTCKLGNGGVWSGVPDAYICFQSISKYYCTHVGKTSRKIALPAETYRWIPIWLFPFVLRWCKGDPLYEAIRGGDDSITFYVDMFDAAIIRAANTASITKGAIPLEMANLCRSMLRVAAEFFEYEERHNVRQRMIEMKNAIIEHKEAILEHEETIRAESKKNENTRELMKRMLTQIETLQHSTNQLRDQFRSMKRSTEGEETRTESPKRRKKVRNHRSLIERGFTSQSPGI